MYVQQYNTVRVAPLDRWRKISSAPRPKLRGVIRSLPFIRHYQGLVTT